MSKNNYRACALTGHRDLPPDFDRFVLYDTLGELIAGGCTSFLCGMARGFDLIALTCLAGLSRESTLSIEACIPYPGFERSFPEHDRKLYRDLLGYCDKKTVLYPAYRNGCFLGRDRYMVDGADVLLAYCRKTTGGTAYTVGYAEKQGIPVIRL